MHGGEILGSDWLRRQSSPARCGMVAAASRVSSYIVAPLLCASYIQYLFISSCSEGGMGVREGSSLLGGCSSRGKESKKMHEI